MKITSVEVFVLGKESNDLALSSQWRPIGCRIHTDEGIYGDGEAAMAFGTGAPAAFGMICDLARIIIGQDPLRIDYLWETMYKTSFWGQNGGPVVFAGIGALDIALWDIKGKYFNCPIYQLLGGKHHDKLRCYASQLQLGWPELGAMSYELAHKTEDYAASAKKAVKEGYDAIKIDFMQNDTENGQFHYQRKTGLLSRDMLDMVEERMGAVREAVGEKVDIIVENHSFTSASGAIQIAKIAEKYNAFCFEEPNTPTPQTARFIKNSTSIPIANGERIYTRWQYAPYFVDQTIQMIQPDIGNSGGITEVRKVADMAHTYDILVQAHAFASPLSSDVAAQFETAIPNFCIHEHAVCYRMGFNFGFTKYNRQPVNGCLEPAELPGIGNEFLQEAIDKAQMYCVVK
jgi:L-alanine-DL-glutamate epimerase-like enolase superfamily enzyme